MFSHEGFCLFSIVWETTSCYKSPLKEPGLKPVWILQKRVMTSLPNLTSTEERMGRSRIVIRLFWRPFGTFIIHNRVRMSFFLKYRGTGWSVSMARGWCDYNSTLCNWLLPFTFNWCVCVSSFVHWYLNIGSMSLKIEQITVYLMPSLLLVRG